MKPLPINPLVVPLKRGYCLQMTQASSAKIPGQTVERMRDIPTFSSLSMILLYLLLHLSKRVLESRMK
jgi:hypothetical protein